MRRIALCAIAALTIIATPLLAAPASSQAAVTFGGFELSGGEKLPAIQIPGSAIRSFSLGISGNLGGGGGWGGGKYVPKSAPVLTLVAKTDGNGSTALSNAALKGLHYKLGELTFEGGGTGHAYCLSDALVSSLRIGHDLKDPLVAQIDVAYASLKVKTGAGASCSGGGSPVESSLLGLRGKSLVARVDCLSAKCRGILTVSLPNAACRGGESKCSFTGGVRVGLDKLGKVHFDSNGTASFTGGVKVGIGGAGKFSMGDGSVKILRLHVPAPLMKWLKGHGHATLGSIIVVRGRSRALVEKHILGAAPKLPSGIPMSGEAGAAPGEETPPLQPQSLAVTSCSTPVVGTPTVVTVAGSLSPPRGGAAVTLTYTPTNGPLPLPSPVVDEVMTNAAGNFEESFDRRQEGKDYSWEVVASIAAGGGFAAAQSPPCSIPIP